MADSGSDRIRIVSMSVPWYVACHSSPATRLTSSILSEWYCMTALSTAPW